ncbi:hypothetical protein [Dysgonomonas massiliensis]|uniref:hypothetical protein n=1 Tax=Dysgonomonas massiliensis TaxID=2040292 RepID=UPI000C78FDB3|nr:hypothetical protein [Dysgonomonas massiliensis]
MKDLTCSVCQNRFKASLQYIDDGEWYYKCPKCGTLFDEQNNAYTKNEEDYYEEDENLGS